MIHHQMGLLNLSVFALLMLEFSTAQQPTAPPEVDAINKIIDHWNLRSKLNISVDPCIRDATWAPDTANPRIACDCSATQCHITHLKIYALDIAGEIPQELFSLTELMDLNLGQNVLNGSLSEQIGQLSKMEYLSLGINNFTSPLPAALGNLTKLISLSFSSNNFHGTLPKELGNLTSLQQLYMDSSGVSGPIPDEFSNLQSLKTLWASDNRFTGTIPDFLGTFTDMEDLRLEGTDLEGPIPSSFGDLNKLSNLRISDLLGGSDSSLAFLGTLTSLSILSLRNCRVGGQLPELSMLPNLKVLDLSFNKLSGPVPASFKNFSSLKYLYLGSNNLNGVLPWDVFSPDLIALDVSFNPLSGNVPMDRKDLSLNIVGTSINNVNLNNKKANSMLYCLQGETRCSTKDPITLFSANCGGKEQTSPDGIEFDDDSEILGAASLYTSSNNKWAVSSSGVFISNPNGSRYIAQTDSQITNTLDSELYKTARIAPSSLRYYGLGLENGVYQIELHFADIQMDDSPNTWQGLGRRLFDVYIQDERVLQDFNIMSEAGGSKKALIKKFTANVTNTVMDIHLSWAGKGTCCIPQQSTYGPLISAVHVSQVSALNGVTRRNKKRNARILGYAFGGAAVLVILCSVIYLKLIKKETGHIKIHTDSPTKDKF